MVSDGPECRSSGCAPKCLTLRKVAFGGARFRRADGAKVKAAEERKGLTVGVTGR